jgi:hypothetical protein
MAGRRTGSRRGSAPDGLRLWYPHTAANREACGLLCLGTGSGVSELQWRNADQAVVLQQVHRRIGTARKLLRVQGAWRLLLPTAVHARYFLQLCCESFSSRAQPPIERIAGRRLQAVAVDIAVCGRRDRCGSCAAGRPGWHPPAAHDSVWLHHPRAIEHPLPACHLVGSLPWDSAR